MASSSTEEESIRKIVKARSTKKCGDSSLDDDEKTDAKKNHPPKKRKKKRKFLLRTRKVINVARLVPNKRRNYLRSKFSKKLDFACVFTRRPRSPSVSEESAASPPTPPAVSALLHTAAQPGQLHRVAAKNVEEEEEDTSEMKNPRSRQLTYNCSRRSTALTGDVSLGQLTGPGLGETAVDPDLGVTMVLVFEVLVLLVSAPHNGSLPVTDGHMACPRVDVLFSVRHQDVNFSEIKQKYEHFLSQLISRES